jgi:hypothetical protein
MTTTTNPRPDVTLPPGATHADSWQPDGYRIIGGPDRGITDTDVSIWTSAFQRSDGQIDVEPEAAEGPRVHVQGDVDLNSDQARELASALLEAAAEIDAWASHVVPR